MSSVDLPPPDTPVTQVNRPSGTSAVMFLRLLALAPRTRIIRSGVRRPALFRHRDLLQPDEVLAGERGGIGHDLVRRSGGHDLAAMHSGAGADIDDEIGGADGLLVVLDHQHGIAEIAQMTQGFEQPGVVALMQADRRLVEHIENAGQARADLRGEPDALAFTPRERPRTARQREIVEPDVDEKLQPLADFLENAVGDLPFFRLEPGGKTVEPVAGLADRHVGHLADVQLRRP